MNHTWYECPQPCETIFCQFCDGGLGYCTVCRCFEGTLPSECPGSAVSEETQQQIYDGQLDFRGGSWVEGSSRSASSHIKETP